MYDTDNRGYSSPFKEIINIYRVLDGIHIKKYEIISKNRNNNLNYYFTGDGKNIVISGLYDSYLINLNDDSYTVFNRERYNGEYVFINKDNSLIFFDEKLHDLKFLDEINYKYENHFDKKFSPDYKYYTKLDENKIEVYDTLSGELVRNLFGHSGDVVKSFFTPDGKSLISFGVDKKIIVWDYKTGAVKHFLQGHKDRVSDIAVSRDNKYLLSGSVTYSGKSSRELYYLDNDTNELKLWDLESGKLLYTIGPESRIETSVEYSSNGDVIVTSGYDPEVFIWSTDNGKIIKSLEHGFYDHPSGTEYIYLINARLSPDGSKIVSFGKNGQKDTFKVWDLINGKILYEKKFKSGVTELEYYKDGSQFVACSNMRNSLSVFKTDTGQKLNEIRADNARINYGMAFTPDNNFVITGEFKKKITLWDLNLFKESNSFGNFVGSIMTVDISPDGKYAAGGGQDKIIKVWNLDNYSLAYEFEGHGKLVTAVKFSPDGKYFASGGWDNNIKLWNMKTGDLEYTFTGHTSHIYDIDFSNSSKVLISVSYDGTKRIWNLETKKSASIIHKNDKSWIVRCDDGRFDCHKSVKKYLYFVRGNRIYDLDEYWMDYYTPGLLGKIIRGE